MTRCANAGRRKPISGAHMQIAVWRSQVEDVDLSLREDDSDNQQSFGNGQIHAKLEATRATIMTRFYQPDLRQNIESPFIRDSADKLVRRSYWLDMNVRTLVGIVTLTRFTYKLRQFAAGGSSICNGLADAVKPP